MNVRPRETVIFADDFHALINWYKSVLNFEAIQLYEQDYHYCVLENEAGMRLGIASASEMGVTPRERQHNSVVLQFEVADVRAFFEHIEKAGGSVNFGPSLDKKDGFWYGGFADVEGNPFWVVDENCP